MRPSAEKGADYPLLNKMRALRGVLRIRVKAPDHGAQSGIKMYGRPAGDGIVTVN